VAARRSIGRRLEPFRHLLFRGWQLVRRLFPSRHGDRLAGEPVWDAPLRDEEHPSTRVRARRPGGAYRNAPPRDEEHPPTRIEMVRIPGGSFWMGSADDDWAASADERPRHLVALSPYWMAEVPVTQKLYREVMNAEPGSPEGDDLPINNVSWFDAVRFCNRLSQMEGLVPAYREEKDDWRWDRAADGYRLPTEAEWEYAARGDDERKYPWGNERPSNQLCWNGAGNDRGQGNRYSPSPVGSYPSGASPFGLLDMAGNVWEWCWDRYGPYAGVPVRNPAGAGYDNTRIRRGGSWEYRWDANVRAAYRGRFVAFVRSKVVGFRCARGPTR
jgi:formylglycine-generating enzyme required for sulfatase activity